ncbi:MAG: DNA repair protein RecO [Candidatus Omnitrophica bacterium]|nr:DNA repair protein RecO [Candidatus Omnitrophota bacterium]
MAIHKTEAIVLKRFEFGETSMIANFYTLDFGKLSGILKGIRNQPEKFASSLEPFSYNEIVFYKKRDSLHFISQCDIKNNFDSLRQDIIKVGIASLIMELIDALMPEEEQNQEIFKLTLDSLKELMITNNPYKIAIIFKIKILALSGFKPHLDSCVLCQQKILTQTRFSFKFGGLLCKRCSYKDPKSRSVFRGTVASILHIEKNDLKNNLNLGMNFQIKKELELILDMFLNFHLEKELKSQRFLNKLSLTS